MNSTHREPNTDYKARNIEQIHTKEQKYGENGALEREAVKDDNGNISAIYVVVLTTQSYLLKVLVS